MRAQVWAIHKLLLGRKGSKLMNWRKLWTHIYSKKPVKGASENHEKLMTSFINVSVSEPASRGRELPYFLE